MGYRGKYLGGHYMYMLFILVSSVEKILISIYDISCFYYVTAVLKFSCWVGGVNFLFPPCLNGWEVLYFSGEC